MRKAGRRRLGCRGIVLYLGHGKWEMLGVSEEMSHTELDMYIWTSGQRSGLEMKMGKDKWLTVDCILGN